jgi:hypothetical protein
MEKTDIIKIIILCIALVLLIISRVWLPKNNPMGVIAEDVIKVETGSELNLDFDSSDKK